ncbi:MAG: MarR family winged helix-turn-helix transcriptional regulator [Granulosicoccaceae bacterium]
MIDQKDEHEIHALNQALELLHFGYRAFTAEADEILQHQQLGRVHHRILYFVAREPGIDVATLRATLAVSKQALHGPLRKLQEDGLVVHKSHPTDKRSRCLQLSEQGQMLEQQVTQAQHALLLEVLGEDKTVNEHWREVMRRLAGRETDRDLGP